MFAKFMLAAALGLTASVLPGAVGAARAEIMSYSATGFVRHCPCVEDGTQESNTHDGVLELTGQFSTFYANVDFPQDGQNVCSVSLVYRDVNGNDAIRARLYKKTFASGSNAFAAPTLMATATSAAEAGRPKSCQMSRRTPSTSWERPLRMGSVSGRVS